MSKMTFAELTELAKPFAGLDTEEVFNDFVAGRFVSGYDIMGAISQVKRLHPHLAEQLAEFEAQVSDFHSLWT